MRGILLVPLVLVLLFEEWGWQPLARFFNALGRHRVWAAIEKRIRNLPPWGALLAFGVPVLTLVPLKLLALYLLAEGHAVLGLGLVLAAKIVGTTLAARLFQLTEPALMQLPWFARLYEPWKRWKNGLLAQLRNSAFWLALQNALLRGRRWSMRAWMAIKNTIT